MNKWNLYCISKNLSAISNICYKMNNMKSSDSISVFKGWFWTWESRSSLEIFKYFSSLWKRRSWSSRLYSLREKVLIWERERERPSLGSNFFILGNDFVYLVGSLKMKGKGLFIEKSLPPPRHLRSNYELHHLLGLYLGINLI